MLTPTVEVDGGGAVHLGCAGWPALAVEGLRPSIGVDGAELTPARTVVEDAGAGSHVLTCHFEGHIVLELRLTAAAGAVEIRGTLRHGGRGRRALEEVVLLGMGPGRGRAAFGADGTRVVVLEQGNYWGRVRRLGEAPEAGLVQGEPDAAEPRVEGASDHVWVAYDPQGPAALLAGFTTCERWQGRVRVAARGDGGVVSWGLGFDGADVALAPGQEVALEEAILLASPDPWRLLEDYGDRVAARHGHAVDIDPPVSWCSWYPFRLGVTQERVLDTARVAARRLRPLGLSVIQVDLGWQAGNLPSTFDENERFAGGLRRLADQLDELGLRLGVWTAPYSISEFDPVARQHPEFLIPDARGAPAVTGTWFWEPHGEVHLLDLTHPGAQDWLRQRLRSLASRGVRYLKADFIGCAAHPLARRRHDDTIAAGGGTEAGRIGGRILREAFTAGLVLNCGGPEMPGTGALPLLYTCNDTGNTGFIATAFRRRNTLALACHLWKQGRWGVIQPSCLSVGLPGTVEEARMRATIAFLAGGQVDISDDLMTLPEDRWSILTATLPPLGRAARPVDLFEPLPASGFSYEGSTRGEDDGGQDRQAPPPGSVWHLRVETDWDAWDLVGVFSFAEDADAATPGISRFAIPLIRLGLDVHERLTGYEFWSCQYLGPVPGGRTNPGGYTHPGDFQDLLVAGAPGTLDLAFFGPAARLVCLRRRRAHPWVAGTSFNQSCGTELADVAWDDAAGVLSGALQRPPGATGTLTLSTAGRAVSQARVDAEPAPVRAMGQHAVLPIVTRRQTTRWEVRFDV